MTARRRERDREQARRECQRQVSKVMDAAPAWRDWFAWHLELLDLEYDHGHWMTMEPIRG